ncbi:MAG: 2-dehydropantoate 2-reductase N-terminal domain-containing protein [Caldilineaceae bacterium]
MAQIAILGAGVMGTAFSTPFADNGHAVNLVGTHLDADIIEEIHETRIHPRLRVRVPDRVQPYTYDRLGEAIQGAELLVVGVNSLGIDWAAQQLSKVLPPDLPVLFLTKGLAGHEHSLQILPYALRDGFPAALRNSVRLAAIGGPSIAGELAVRRHTCVIVTGTDQALLDKLAGLLRTPYYHVWTNTDLIGVEVCVALKNVYALAVGLVIGLLEKEGTAENGAVMHNTAAALFAQGLWETAYLVEQMGGQPQSVFTLPGAGDLYVTAQGGRNCRMGRYLGLGMRYSEAKAKHMPDDTIEGAELALAIGSTVTAMIAEGKLAGDRLPLLQTMIQIVCQDDPVALPWERFFAH